MHKLPGWYQMIIAGVLLLALYIFIIILSDDIAVSIGVSWTVLMNAVFGVMICFVALIVYMGDQRHRRFFGMADYEVIYSFDEKWRIVLVVLGVIFLCLYVVVGFLIGSNSQYLLVFATLLLSNSVNASFYVSEKYVVFKQAYLVISEVTDAHSTDKEFGKSIEVIVGGHREYVQCTTNATRIRIIDALTM